MSVPTMVNTGKHAVVPQLPLPVRPNAGTASERPSRKGGPVTRAERSLEAELKAMGNKEPGSTGHASPFETGAEIWDLLASAARNESGR